MLKHNVHYLTVSTVQLLPTILSALGTLKEGVPKAMNLAGHPLFTILKNKKKPFLGKMEVRPTI
ncbi:hypothetical protein [Paenibacillus phytorum]|uniref:hypothetical protein n=1 Tax=Paenibacillus phytorum TaxID=2654977 RepID=UPI0014924D35|nr:hypothetical protein [Paenibacillus phytorum]